MNEDIKVGDIVQLKSGGPKITAIELPAPMSRGYVGCAWFDHNGLSCKDRFPTDALILVKGSDK